MIYRRSSFADHLRQLELFRRFKGHCLVGKKARDQISVAMGLYRPVPVLISLVMREWLYRQRPRQAAWFHIRAGSNVTSRRAYPRR